MKLDATTVIILTVINVSIMLMILLHTRLTRKTYSGFDVWVTGSAFWVAGAILSYIFRGVIGQFWVIVVGNSLMLALPICFLDGINRFYAIPSRWWRTPFNAMALAVAAALLYYFTFVSESISARGIVISCSYALFFSRAALEPLHVPYARRHSMQWLLFAGIMPMVIVHILRVRFFVEHPELHTFAEVVAKDTLLTLVMMMSGVNAIIISYSYISLTSDRVEEELTASEQRMSVAYDAERESREMQDRFLDMISHEYRTPVAIIQTNLDILDLKSADKNSIILPELKKMHRAVGRLVEMFESTRRREGFGRRSIAPVLELVEVAPYLHDIFNFAADLWGNRFVLRTQVTERCLMRVDQKLFRTAILNLLDNAATESPPQGDITLKIDIGSQFLTIAVANSTCDGLPADVIVLLNKYQRGGNSAATSGTGVGLYLTSKIIEEHGGRITLEAISNDVLVTVRVPYETGTKGEPNGI